jgi:hypothetical protein
MHALNIPKHTKENIFFKENNSMSCVNFNNTALWGSEEFGSGSKIEIKFEFCKEGDVLPENKECWGVDKIFNNFKEHNLTVFGAYNLQYVDFNNYTEPV